MQWYTTRLYYSVHRAAIYSRNHIRHELVDNNFIEHKSTDIISCTKHAWKNFCLYAYKHTSYICGLA